ncbi:UbiA prenyltransferase family protein [Defluviimonas sp. D31]|uniref:UbiA prenyltransferase family protein n=1 Tax=Defluviimonas sp. D31 TaxID=3083253 RepID=UPI00296EAA3F|nr:UbiA prenyltransferase family protein [Defluviimonas sp. D31]MDW4550574.1 UbiA prenyltransferase family protein [Defluviimonas sp. D31]
MSKSASSGKISVARDYISVARPDHWGKNIFMLPGAAIAAVIDPEVTASDTVWLGLGLVSTCLIASANYTINEYLDGAFDQFHPKKSSRPAAQNRLNGKIILAQYCLLCALGLGVASLLNPVFFYASVTLLIMGIIYNVEPIRSKDTPFLDVLSESFNNPIRLTLGWSAISTIVLPPVSLLITYWMGGAYLMATKRYSEFRSIGDPERAALYRRSFKYYTEDMLSLSAFFYALCASLFLGIFLIKYKIEFIIAFPFFAALFVWYQILANKKDSLAASPEKLYLDPRFMIYVGFLTVLVGVLSVTEITAIRYLTEHSVLKDIRVE